MKHLQGKDFRRAFRAIAALRGRRDPALAQAIARVVPPDDQRRFQSLVAAIVAADGVAGLARRWPELPSPEWRARLISEIGQFLPEWSDPRLIDLFMAALDDHEVVVTGQAVAFLHQALRQPADRGRRDARRTRSGPRLPRGKRRLPGFAGRG